MCKRYTFRTDDPDEAKAMLVVFGLVDLLNEVDEELRRLVKYREGPITDEDILKVRRLIGEGMADLGVGM